MSYAAVQDLVDAFGEDEIVRITTRDGADIGAVDQVRAQARLDEASAFMDSYMRKRYIVPIAATGGTAIVLRRCCCDLARKYLHERGNSQPSDQVLGGAKHQIAWLEGIVDGKVTLDGAVLAGPLSGARTSDRRPMQRATGPLGTGRGGGGGW